MSKPTAVISAQEWIDNNKDEMVAKLQGVLKIPSVQGTAEPDAPFGADTLKALEYTLKLAEQWGFKTKNLDGFVGYAEFGEGEEMVAALCHLDVVPVGDGWKYDPFGATIDDGYIYARGANDDKGPSYAALFAAKAIKESGAKLNRRIRLVFGLNEESGFRCVAHYNEHEPAPTYGFAPDAGWPLIYAEKGILNLTIEKTVEQTGDLKVVKIESGQRSNIIPDLATAVLKGSETALKQAEAILAEYWDKNVSYKLNGDELTLTAIGKPAHGSAPWHGDNAATRLLRTISALSLTDAGWLEFLFEASDPAGMKMGYNGRDDVAGNLTNNMGILKFDGQTVKATFNIRYPVTWDSEKIKTMTTPKLEKAGFTICDFRDSKPLYFPTDKEPVKTLLDVYELETGKCEAPGTMGGGTYARAVPNCVAVGSGFEGDGPAHEKDERYAIDSYIRCSKIYAHMFYALAVKI